MGEFSVAIIPYTFEHTNLKNVKAGDTVNLEFDIIGKYVARLMAK
jgi:riboflavin synthase